jgi:hypothetical protein
MERTPSPVHIPVVPTGDDNTRLAVDEAGVVIGDRSGPLIAEDAPLRVPRRYRCIRRITTAQGVSVLATPIRRPVLDAAVAMGDTVRRSSALASRTLPPVQASLCAAVRSPTAATRHNGPCGATTPARVGSVGSVAPASPHGRMRMIVFPLNRSVELKAATASSRVETLPMIVRSRPFRTRWTISLSWARSGTTTKSIARPAAGRDRGGPAVVTSVPPADVFQGIVVEVDELLRAEVERGLPVGGTSGADDVGTGLASELRHHRSDSASRAVHQDALPA